MSDPIVDKIFQIIESANGKSHAQAIGKEIASLERSELFAWLSDQDNSIRYHLALELDIPLQHLDHTCSTLKQIRHK